MERREDTVHVFNAYAIKNGQWILDFCEYNGVDEPIAIAACVLYKRFLNGMLQRDDEVGIQEAYNYAVACLRMASKLDDQCFDENRALFNLFGSIAIF